MHVSCEAWRPAGNPADSLVLDLLEWIAHAPRPYPEVMEAWRTSCPRLSVWEDAEAAGLAERRSGRPFALVAITPQGEAALREAGRAV